MPQTENGSRERILARVRNALREPVPPVKPREMKAVFAPVTELLERFRRECATNVTECLVTRDMAETAREIAKALSSTAAGNIFVEDCAELRRLASHFGDNGSIQWSSEGAPAESTQATITKCEALVAQTGSVLVSAACGGRAGSIVAPIHIVVATADQLVSDLDAALARVQSCGVIADNSYVCLITGSSRTADIEKILVMGAHGPRRLLVFLSVS